jgi:hypothetical protein
MVATQKLLSLLFVVGILERETRERDSRSVPAKLKTSFGCVYTQKCFFFDKQGYSLYRDES